MWSRIEVVGVAGSNPAGSSIPFRNKRKKCGAAIAQRNDLGVMDFFQTPNVSKSTRLGDERLGVQIPLAVPQFFLKQTEKKIRSRLLAGWGEGVL